ncbi:MAG: cyclic 2,3-diphosphoglycerate synthase [Thermodesulfovibrionales bacterium]
MERRKVIIMGAAGRDFHNFNTVYRDDPSYEIIAFTAAQIPFIERRIYPPELSGPHYPEGIPIYPEDDLGILILKHRVNQVIFAYSDVSHEYVMHRASQCLSLGADFVLLGPESTMLKSTVPVISICAVRTGCGKSIITRKLAHIFKERGIEVSVIRHPMPYRAFIPVIRFSTMEDIDRAACTIEEREEFEPLVGKGITVYAGVDYRGVLDQAQRDSRVILWDGGNNDFPFILPDLEVVLIDALRPGHEMLFFPGEVNLRRADYLIITKVNEAKESDLKGIRNTITMENPDARVFDASTILTLSDYALAKGKKALVIEDGPTVTHGGMPHGAGISASMGIVSEFIDPRPYAVGSIKETYRRFPHIGPVLPAMGYSDEQIRELEETILMVPSDVVIIATPVDLRRIIKIDKPTVRVSYDLDIDLNGLVGSFLKDHAL